MSEDETQPQQPPESPAADAPPEQGEVPAPAGGVDEALRQAREDGEGLFGRGEALSTAQAARIAAQRRATVVILAGAPDSGKTTLLAALYERFGLGKLAGHWFLGSRTLHGFDQRCHRSTYGAGPGSGDEGHTAGDALPWLHLRTARQEHPTDIRELLLGDLSGDHFFKGLADGSLKASEVPGMRRADHVCVTINGGALADPIERIAEQSLLLDMLHALLDDPDGLADPGALSFVVTKWDLVHRGGSEARSAVGELFERLRGMLPPETAALQVGYLETAARSTATEFPIGYGVGDLLSRFTDRPALHISHHPQSARPATPFERFEAQ